MCHFPHLHIAHFRINLLCSRDWFWLSNDKMEKDSLHIFSKLNGITVHISLKSDIWV